MGKVFKIIIKFILWLIAAVILNFVILAIAIVMNGGNPVSGANCTFITIIIMLVIMAIVNSRKKKDKTDKE